MIYTDSNCYYDFYGLAIYFPAIDYSVEFQSYLDNDYGLIIVSSTYWKIFLTDWKTELSSLIPTWDETSEYTSTISAGEKTIIQADLPATPVDDAYIVTLGIESDMEVTLRTWNEEKTFYSSSFMPLNIPETVGFFCDSSTNVFFIISCNSGSGTYALNFYWIDVVDDSHEDNDNFSQATSLDINSTYFMMGMDVDFFEINVEAGDSITAAIEFNLANDYDLYIYDQSHREVDFSAGYSHPEVVEFIAEYTGVYYLCVDPFDIPYIPYYTISTRVTPDEPPVIENIVHSPLNPEINDTITISCLVEDNMGIESVQLWYNTTSGWTFIVMIHIGGGIYQAIIPYQAGAISIQYYIIAEDIYEHTTTTHYYNVTYIEPEPTETPTPTDKTELSNMIFIAFILIAIPIIIRRKK